MWVVWQKVICDAPQKRCLSAESTVQDHKEGKEDGGTENERF